MKTLIKSTRTKTAIATPMVQMARILGGGLLGTGLLLTSLLSGAKPASADTAIVPFGGSLAGGCFFGSVTAGSLAFTGAPPTTVTGTGGVVPLTCTAAGTLSVAAPATTASHTGTVPTASNVSATVTSSLSTITSNGSTSVAVPASGAAYPLTVTMTHNNGTTPLTPGTYSYTVTLTATP